MVFLAYLALVGPFRSPADALLPPTTTWVVSPRFALGEPIFVDYRITNPNDESITVLLKPSRLDWFQAHLESDSPLAHSLKKDTSLCRVPASPTGQQGADQLHNLVTQPIPPHGTYEHVSFVWPAAGASIPGAYRLVLDSTLAFRAGSSSDERALAIDQSAHIDGSVPIEVVVATDSEVASDADLLGSEYYNGTYHVAPGIRQQCPWFFDAWLNMPAKPSAPVWRRYLFSGRNDMWTVWAARVLAQRSEPEVTQLLQDIKAYIHARRPDLEPMLKIALRRAQTIRD